MNKPIPLTWTTVFATNTSQRIIPASPWIPAGDIVKVRGTMELAEHTGDLEVGLGIDTANVEDAPDQNPTVIIARQATDGMVFGASYVDVSSATAGKRLARFVWLTANTSTSAFTAGRVGGYVELELRS